MKRRINIYDIEVAERLMGQQKPFAYKIGNLMLDETIGEVQILRTFADCIIEMENIIETNQKELVKYKMMYGEL